MNTIKKDRAVKKIQIFVELKIICELLNFKCCLISGARDAITLNTLDTSSIHNTA